MSHTFVKRVRFGEVDQAQIVYYPRIFHFCHLAMEDFFENEMGLPYGTIVLERRIGFPAVHLEADFTAPMPFAADLAIEMSFLKAGCRMRSRTCSRNGSTTFAISATSGSR